MILRSKIGCAIVLGCMLTVLASCLSIKVDESAVFAPEPVDEKAASIAAMSLDDEERLLDPSPKDLIEARGFASHLPANITHGFLDLPNENRLAWSLIESVTTQSAQEKRPLIVHCFGNTSDRKRRGVFRAEQELAWGDVFLFDYPGYGDSTGEATTRDMQEMQLELGRYIDEVAKGRPLIFWGHSLGGFVCSELATASQEVDAMVLEATALNVFEVSKEWRPWYVSFIKIDIKESLKDYDNARALSFFPGPILVLGARKDKTLPVELARDLRKALKKRDLDVTYIEFKKAGHSTITRQFDFLDRVEPFFARVKDLD